MNGPDVAGRACHLAAIIDDRSRFLPGARFVRRPDAVRFAAVLRAAIPRHGIPQILYTDNGSCFADASLQRTCAVLGIKLTHSAPGRPDGQGEDRTGIRDYPAAVPGRGHRRRRSPGPAPGVGLEELNDLLDRWVRAVYHARVHSETGETPQARWEAAGPPAAAGPGAAEGGVLLERGPAGPQDRDRLARGQHLLRRPVPGRPEGRAGLRPVRHDPDGRVLAGPQGRDAPSRRSSAGTPTPRPRRTRTPPRPP